MQPSQIIFFSSLLYQCFHSLAKMHPVMAIGELWLWQNNVYKNEAVKENEVGEP